MYSNRNYQGSRYVVHQALAGSFFFFFLFSFQRQTWQTLTPPTSTTTHSSPPHPLPLSPRDRFRAQQIDRFSGSSNIQSERDFLRFRDRKIVEKSDRQKISRRPYSFQNPQKSETLYARKGILFPRYSSQIYFFPLFHLSLEILSCYIEYKEVCSFVFILNIRKQYRVQKGASLILILGENMRAPRSNPSFEWVHSLEITLQIGILATRLHTVTLVNYLYSLRQIRTVNRVWFMINVHG